IRCGGTYWKGQQFGAIWVYSDQSDITGLRLQNIDIVDATHSGLMFQGPLTLLDSTFTNIRIENSGTYGIRVTGNSKGSATLTGVTVSHSAQGGMLNEAKGNFLFEKKTGNSGLDQ
ncbi:MAG TPA: hypothetical protein VHV83_02375, partial [Armatimonadota bacterium]|nr:hypothetical protein [Armatimonadota bacterium]